jgi:2-amino-4-hydroxy-6-hydroxymethyldihydropteridine diphosphokinase
MLSDVAYIALGSNLGDRARYLADARRRIAAIPGVVVLHTSQIEETAPIGPPGQGGYLNQMIAVSTTLPPPLLLAQLQAIEDACGRQRKIRWGPRTIDLDIVCYAQTTWHAPDLIVPHPELTNRAFWQRELAELHTLIGGTICSSPYIIPS